MKKAKMKPPFGGFVFVSIDDYFLEHYNKKKTNDGEMYHDRSGSDS